MGSEDGVVGCIGERKVKGAEDIGGGQHKVVLDFWD